jgi:glyoxylase-like metal-dependent hydrolase (beta-lactamase superfamily II)
MNRTIVLAIALVGATAALAGEQPPQYEVYAIRYATSPNYRLSGLVEGADPGGRVDIAMTVWLVRGNGRTILVDCGFHRDRFTRGVPMRDYVKPSEAIAKVGLKPEDVSDIVITHAHWDHAGGADLLPNATVWIQKDEYTYYTGEAWQQARTHGGIDPDDMAVLLQRNTQGKLRLVPGDAQEIIPGVTCYTGGRHTYASQYVGVNTKAGTIVLASDNLYLYQNLEQHRPIAQTLDRESNLKAQERMLKIAGDPRRIVPGHDPKVFQLFPKPGDGVAKIE